MSTLNVESISHPTPGSLVTINGTAPSNRNLIINGAMQVAQRGTSFAVTTSETYAVDRFQTHHGGSFNFNSTLTQSSTAPAGFTSSLKVDVTTTSTPTGNQNGLIAHKVEAQNLQHLQYGTSNAQTCTLTFWVRSNKTGTYCLQIMQQDAAKYQMHEYSISSANTWEQKTITIVGNTADAINNDNGKGFDIRWHLACGSNDQVAASSTWTGSSEGFFATSNQVNLFDSTSNEWYLAGVQLEVGSVATPFEHRSFGDELARCQRYFEKSVNYGTAATTATNPAPTLVGSAYATTIIRTQTHYKVPKRATPTVTPVASSTGNGTGTQWARYNGSWALASTSIAQSNENAFSVDLTTSGISRFSTYIIDGNWYASAEL